jgi:hypothetical protein
MKYIRLTITLPHNRNNLAAINRLTDKAPDILGRIKSINHASVTHETVTITKPLRRRIEQKRK